MSESYSTEWNGTDFLISGNGLSNQPFRTFNFYENNYYIFENNGSLISKISVGENNNSIYSKGDVWNNGANANDEYLLLQPDFNSSRILYYFKPDSNSSTGRINISSYDSTFLHPQNNVASFKFGQSVTINDWNQTIFGSPGEAGFDDGALHIFNRESNGSYSYSEKVIPSVSGLKGQFGHSSEVFNEFLFVGSPDISSYSGSVDIYRRESNGSYRFSESLNTYSTTLDTFGWDLSADAQNLAVSSLQTIKSGSGKVSIFEGNGTNWNFISSVSSDDNQSRDEFGYSIDLSGSRLLVGAPKADANGTNSGGAYIFEKNASGWFQTKKLVPTGLSANDEFGYSVTLSQNLAFVGARKKDGNATDAGAVYVFHYDGANWSEISQIYPPSLMVNQFFASDLFFHEDILAVSSPMIGEGEAYLYRVEENGSVITFLSTLSLIDANSSDQSQFSLALSDGVALVGIPGDSTYQSFGGGALAFFNDAWQKKKVPKLAPIIERNSSKLHNMFEDGGTYTYDFNGSHPFDSNLTWSLSLFPDANATFSVDSLSGLFTYTPDGNYSGSHQFSLKLSNGILSDSIDFNVSVNGVQDPPIFFPATSLLSGMEGDEYNQTISVFDADGDSLIISYISPSIGLSISGFNLVGIPSVGSAQGNAFKDYNVTLGLSDGNGNTLQQLFPLRILRRNNPPSIWVSGDSNITILNLNLTEDINSSQWYASVPQLDYNDSDGHRFELNATKLPSFGTLEVNASDVNRSVTYVPNINFNGTDSFTITLRDLEGEGNKTDTLTFNLILSPANDPPVIDSAPPVTQIREGHLFNYPIVIVDPDTLDANSSEINTVTIENLPANRWLDYNSTSGVLSGIPAWSDYEESGPRLIVIKVRDRAGLSDSQAFTLEVIPDNYPPVIAEGSSFSAGLNEDTTISNWGSLNLAVSDTSTSGQLSWAIATNPRKGVASVTGTGNNPSSLTYIPEGNYTGTDTFVLKVFESGDINASDSIIINVNVLPVEDDPVFITSSSGVAVQDYLFDYNITAYDADPNTNLIISSLVALPDWLVLNDNGNGTARLSGTPDQYDLGNNLIVLETRDQTNRFAIQAFMLVVLKQNSSPIIAQGTTISFSLTEDSTWNGSSLVSASDSNGQFLSWSMKSPPAHGSARVSGQGNSPPVLEYIPDANYSGSDSFQVEVSDGIGTDSITINLNIQNVEDSPVFSFLPTNQVTIDNQNFSLSPKVYDADGLTGATAVISGPSWLSVSSFDQSTGDILLSGVPLESDKGNQSYTLNVTDSTGLNVSTSFSVQVRVLNYAPSIISSSKPVTVKMTEDNATSWVAPALGVYDTETKDGNFTWSLLSGPGHGSASVVGNGSSLISSNFIYTPDGNFSGSDSFVVRVKDNGGIESSGPKYDTIVVNVEVTPVNDAPVFRSVPITDTNGSYRWNDESAYIYEVKTFDSDWNYNWHSLDLNVSGSLPEWLTFKDEGNGTGTLYGMAAVKNEGNHTISFEVFDSNQTSSVQTFSLEIKIDNYPPVFKSLSDVNKTITDLVVYVDEDSNSTSSRGAWIAPTNYKAVDPDPGLSSAKTLTWSLSKPPSSGSSVTIEGMGERPTLFTYTPAYNFFGEDIVQLKVNDGHRDSILPVRVQVRGLPDIPTFSTSINSILIAKEGAQFNFDISTSDPDNSPRTIKVYGLPSGGKSWIQLMDQNSTTGTARLYGVPPSQTSGNRYQLAFVVTDDTGRFSVANTQLVVDGKNSSPVINIGNSAIVRFDQSGNAKPSDISRLYATDLENGILKWSLSPNSTPSFGTAIVSGDGVQTPNISYLSYSSPTEDKFKIQVSDGISFDEIEITAVVVDSFETFEISDPTISSISAGRLLIEHFKVSKLIQDSKVEALLVKGPSWLKIEKVEYDLFKLKGVVPFKAMGDFPIQISFLENGKSKLIKDYTLKVTDGSPPNLKLKGDEFIRLRIGQAYEEPGYISTDQGGENLSSSVEVNGTVDNSEKGLYEIVYRSTDSGGNFSELKRTIQVIEGNNSVLLNSVNSSSSVKLIDFIISDRGVYALESVSAKEAKVSKYGDYSNLSNPLQSLTFKAEDISLEKILPLQNGSFLVGGIFRGNLSFGDNLIASKGNHNLFVIKLDSNFNRIWIKNLSCTSTFENLVLMEANDRAIQLGGNFQKQIQFDSRTWNAQGGSDNFIWNLKENGEFAWLKTFGGTGLEEMIGLNKLPDGSFLSVSNTKNASDPMYCTIIKFSKNGDVLAGKSLITGFHNKAIGLKIENESIYISGEFKTKLVIEDKTVLSNTSGSGFISLLNPDLVPSWLVSFSSSGKTSAEGIQTDPFGFPLAVLRFEGDLSLSGSSQLYSSIGQNDLMIIKLNSSNGSILWEKPIGSAGNDTLFGFEVDSFGTIMVGVGLTVPFSLNGNLISEGSDFLFKLDSVQGSPSFAPVGDLVLFENEFFNQEIKVLNQAVVRMKKISGPEWIDFHDNLDGTGMLGGLVPTLKVKSGSIQIRAYNADGGVSDLDLNYSVAKNSKPLLSTMELPNFSFVHNFGKDVSISSSTHLRNGGYLIGGTFLNSIRLGQNTLSKQGNVNGFVSNLGIDGKFGLSLHLISSGSLTVGSILAGPDDELYIMGDFTDSLKVGPYSVTARGGSDLYIVQWSKEGALKNLTRLGGSGDEYFKKSIIVRNNFLISGQFTGTFSHDAYSIKSNGQKDGFILKVPQVEVSNIEWFKNFGGVNDDFVSDLGFAPTGKIFLVGSYFGESQFGSLKQFSSGLKDCFLGKLDMDGNWENVYSGGGPGNDEITSFTLQSDNRIIICGNFVSDFKWGNRKVTSSGKQDGFIATLSDSGHCVSLSAYGGVGNDSIDALVNNGGQISIAGSFDNQISFAKESFSTKGGRDSYIALLASNGSDVIDAEQMGGGGEDIIGQVHSSMTGHFIVSGISGGDISKDGSFSSLSLGSQNSYVSFFGPNQFSPMLLSAPKTSVISSSVYEYEFSTGPWPNNAELNLSVYQKPEWLNIEIFKGGRGLVWGQSPINAGTISTIKFDINSTGMTGLTSEWKIEVMDSSKAFFILGEPLTSSPQFSHYKSEFTLSGSRMDDILIFPQDFPSWLKLVRNSKSNFSIEGTPLAGDLGSYKIQVLVQRFIDQNSTHREELSYDLTIEPKILQDAVSTSYGNWKTNWLGYFESFENLWTYHEDFLWVYLASGTRSNEVWFWTEKWGWLWTDSENWNSSSGKGYLYSSLSGGWMYFQRKQPDLSAVVFNYAEGKWLPYE